MLISWILQVTLNIFKIQVMLIHFDCLDETHYLKKNNFNVKDFVKNNKTLSKTQRGSSWSLISQNYNNILHQVTCRSWWQKYFIPSILDKYKLWRIKLMSDNACGFRQGRGWGHIIVRAKVYLSWWRIWDAGRIHSFIINILI